MNSLTAANKCIILLSEKSSGSSAVQRFLGKYADVNHVQNTRHYQYETLYWTKAASILGMDQISMVDSEVPIEKRKAKNDLLKILTENIEKFDQPKKDYDLVMSGWESLCNEYAPVFFEKSPHHLCQWSALELIVKAISELNIDFLIVGLVRNPMDTIYSQYKRWKSKPEEVERQWNIAYNNLLNLKEILGEQLCIVRYEDIAFSEDSLEPILDFLKVGRISSVSESKFHSNSISKWKNDRFYGHILKEETIILASNFGYKNKDLWNDKKMMWSLKFYSERFIYKLKRMLKNLLNNSRK